MFWLATTLLAILGHQWLLIGTKLYILVHGLLIPPQPIKLRQRQQNWWSTKNVDRGQIRRQIRRQIIRGRQRQTRRQYGIETKDMCSQWHHHSHCHSLEDRPSCTTTGRTTTVLRLGATPSSTENDNERLEQQDELNIVTFCCPPTTKSPTTTTTTTTTTTPYTITDCPPTAEDQLQAVVQKHVETLDRYLEHRPIAAHTQQAFDEFLDQCWMGCQDRHCDDDDDDDNNKDDKNEPTQTEMRLILDAGCGTGRSTLQIAQLQMKYNEEVPNLDNDKNQHVRNNQNSPLVHKMVVVVGVDRSLARLRRNARYHKNLSFSSATTTTFNVLSSLTPNSNKSNPRLENEEEDQDTVVD